MLEQVKLKEGMVMLFEDGEVHTAVYNTSFFSNMMFKYHVKQINAEVVSTVFTPTHMFNEYECVIFTDEASFNHQFAEAVLAKANLMLKTIGLKEVTA